MKSESLVLGNACLTTVTLERVNTTVVIKHVLAQVCDNCGEAHLDDTTTRRVMEIAEAAVAAGAVVQVQEYVAA